MNPWKTIESAPKDREIVLWVNFSDGTCPVRAKWEDNEWGGSWIDILEDCGIDHDIIAHWIPSPNN